MYPQPTGIVFDLPRAASAAQQTIDAGGLGDRCRFVAGDALETVPDGYDAHVLSNFLVSWGMITPSSYCETAGKRLPKTVKFCSLSG